MEENKENNDFHVIKLEHEVSHNKNMDKEREISDNKYAPILIEKIVYGMIGTILLTVLAAFLRVVLK